MADEFKIKSKEEKIAALNDLMGDMDKLNSMGLKEHSEFIKDALGGSIPTFEDADSVKKYQEFIKDKIGSFTEGSKPLTDAELPYMANIVKGNRFTFQDKETKSDAFYNEAMGKIQDHAKDLLANSYRMEKLDKETLQAFADNYIEASYQSAGGKKTFDNEVRKRLNYMKELDAPQEIKTPAAAPEVQSPASDYNWDKMDYKELSFLNKNLNAANPEQAALKEQLKAYTASKVNAFADGSALIGSSAEYKKLYALIGDKELNGSELDGGEKSLKALTAFASVKGFKNTATGEIDFYDPRSGKTVEEFKAGMVTPAAEGADAPIIGSLSDKEVEDKKELDGSVNQVDAEKMQAQIAQILDSQKGLDEAALQSLKEDIMAHVNGGGDISKYNISGFYASREKSNEEKEQDKNTTDENNLGNELDEKKFTVDAPVENKAEKVKQAQISEAMLAQEDKNWQKYAAENNVIAESVKQEAAVVTKIFNSEEDKKKDDYNAIIERPSEHSANVYGKDGKAPDLSVFQQLVKGAKEEGHDKINIGKDLSDEAKEKAAIAALQNRMAVTGEGMPKQIDMKQDYIKKLDKQTRARIKQYNLMNMTDAERKKYEKDKKAAEKSGRIKPKNLTDKTDGGKDKSKDKSNQTTPVNYGKMAAEMLGGLDR